MKENKKQNRKKPSLIVSLLPLLFMLTLIGTLGVRGGMRSEPIILLSAAFAFLLAQFSGLSWQEVEAEIANKFGKAIGSILILVSVGFVISTWMSAGTIPMLVSYGIRMISPKFLIVTAFIVTCIVSMCTGTSWGSVGTMGVAVMGIAYGLGVNLPMVAGAVISGSYFGDKLSPLSDTTNLAPAVAGSKLYEHIAHMLYTTIPATVICLVVYTFLGFNSGAVSIDTVEISDAIISTIDQAYNLNILLLLPPLIVLLGAIKKISTLPLMAASSLVAGVEAILFQNITLKSLINGAVNGFSVTMITAPGFDAENVHPAVTTLLERGGMMSIMSTTLIVFCAFVFAAVLISAGFLDVILGNLLKIVKSTGALITTNVFSCWLTAFVTGSSHMTILMNGELFAPVYKKKGLAMKNLSRTLEDAGTIIVPLVPWGSAGGYMASTLGVSTYEYMPWAIFCYACGLVAIVNAFIGFGIAKEDYGNEEEAA